MSNSAAMILYEARREHVNVTRAPREVVDHEEFVNDTLLDMDTDFNDANNVHENMRSILGQPEVFL